MEIKMVAVSNIQDYAEGIELPSSCSFSQSVDGAEAEKLVASGFSVIISEVC